MANTSPHGFRPLTSEERERKLCSAEEIIGKFNDRELLRKALDQSADPLNHQRNELAGDRTLWAFAIQKVVEALAPIKDETEYGKIFGAASELTSEKTLDRCARDIALKSSFWYGPNTKQKSGDIIEALITAAIDDGGWSRGLEVFNIVYGDKVSVQALQERFGVRGEIDLDKTANHLELYKKDQEKRRALFNIVGPFAAIREVDLGQPETIDIPTSLRRLFVAALVREVPAGALKRLDLTFIGQAFLTASAFRHFRFLPGNPVIESNFDDHFLQLRKLFDIPLWESLAAEKKIKDLSFKPSGNRGKLFQALLGACVQANLWKTLESSTARINLFCLRDQSHPFSVFYGESLFKLLDASPEVGEGEHE